MTKQIEKQLINEFSNLFYPNGGILSEDRKVLIALDGLNVKAIILEAISTIQGLYKENPSVYNSLMKSLRGISVKGIEEYVKEFLYQLKRANIAETRLNSFLGGKDNTSIVATIKAFIFVTLLYKYTLETNQTFLTRIQNQLGLENLLDVNNILTSKNLLNVLKGNNEMYEVFYRPLHRFIKGFTFDFTTLVGTSRLIRNMFDYSQAPNNRQLIFVSGREWGMNVLVRFFLKGDTMYMTSTFKSLNVLNSSRGKISVNDPKSFNIYQSYYSRKKVVSDVFDDVMNLAEYFEYFVSFLIGKPSRGKVYDNIVKELDKVLPLDEEIPITESIEQFVDFGMNTNLIKISYIPYPKANLTQGMRTTPEVVNIGDRVRGIAYADEKPHQGQVIRIVKNGRGGVMYLIILDEQTSELLRIRVYSDQDEEALE